MLQCEKDGVMFIKPGQMIFNICPCQTNHLMSEKQILSLNIYETSGRCFDRQHRKMETNKLYESILGSIIGSKVVKHPIMKYS